MRPEFVTYVVHGRSYATSFPIGRGSGAYGYRRQYAFYYHTAHSMQLAL